MLRLNAIALLSITLGTFVYIPQICFNRMNILYQMVAVNFWPMYARNSANCSTCHVSVYARETGVIVCVLLVFLYCCVPLCVNVNTVL